MPFVPGTRLIACASDSVAGTKRRAESGRPCPLLLCSVRGADNIPFVSIFACGLY